MPLSGHHVAAEERIARRQRRERVAGQQAVGLDLHRRVEVVVEVVVGDVDVRAEVVECRRGSGKSVSSVMNASTDCEGIVKFCVLTSPPPYWKVAALMTAMAPLWMPTLPHVPGTSLVPMRGGLAGHVDRVGHQGRGGRVVVDRGEQHLRDRTPTPRRSRSRAGCSRCSGRSR